MRAQLVLLCLPSLLLVLPIAAGARAAAHIFLIRLERLGSHGDNWKARASSLRAISPTRTRHARMVQQREHDGEGGCREQAGAECRRVGWGRE